jgi:hypothetical protein
MGNKIRKSRGGDNSIRVVRSSSIKEVFIRAVIVHHCCVEKEKHVTQTVQALFMMMQN